MNRHRIGAAVLAVALGLRIAAAHADDRDLDYPELSVAPRASDRVVMEAAREPSYRWTAFLPVQASGIATFVQGLAHADPANPLNGYVGASVGIATFVTGTLLALTYQPYGEALPAIKALPAGSPRERLVRERFADIAIEDAGRSMKWVKYGIAAANLATAVGNFWGRRTDYLTNPAAVAQTAAGAVAILMSFGPFVFQHPAVAVADQQRTFKSRIYAPLASGGFLPTPDGREIAPGAMLSWRF